MGYPPVVVVESGGVPRTQVAEGVSAPAFTVVDSGARPITLADNAPPIALFNPDGSNYTSDQPIIELDETGYYGWFNRNGTFNNTTPNTFQATFELPFVPVAGGMIIGTAGGQYGAQGACFTSIPNWSDPNGAGRTFTPQLWSGSTDVAPPASPTSGQRWTLLKGDETAMSPIARDDGGEGCIIVSRLYVASAQAALSVMGNGTDDLTNWASRPGGWKRVFRNNVGNCTTRSGGTVGNFVSTTNRSQCPILGFWFRLASGELVCVIAPHGDSITEGRGTYKGEGWLYPAVEAMQAAHPSVKFVPANHGWSSMAHSTFDERMSDALTAGLIPDVEIFPNGSPNDIVGTIDSAAIDAMRATTQTMLGTCASNDIPAILWTWLPTNPAIKDYNSSDSLRVAYDAEVTGRTGVFADDAYTVADANAELSGITDGDGQVNIKVGKTSDGIHPDDSGNSDLALNRFGPALEATVYG